MKLALMIAGRLRQIWKPYVFAAIAAIVAVVVVAVLGATPRQTGVPFELMLASLSVLAAIAGVLLAARIAGFLSELKSRLGRRHIGSD
jgi:hypothetical protein